MVRMFLQEKGHYLGNEAMAEGKRLLDASVAMVDYMDRAEGPSNDHPRFAWERPPTIFGIERSSVFWHRISKAMCLLLVKLLGAGKEGGMIEDYGAALDNITNIEAVIADKLEEQQRRYRTLMRKMGSLNGLSELEVKRP